MNNQDTIFIKKLKIQAFLGIHSWEQTTKQPIILDIKIGIGNKAAHTNKIIDAVNYQEVYDKVVNFVENNKFQLIENFAEHITNLILENFPTVTYVKLKVTKPYALMEALAGITIKRTRNIAKGK